MAALPLFNTAGDAPAAPLPLRSAVSVCLLLLSGRCSAKRPFKRGRSAVFLCRDGSLSQRID